MEEMKKGGLPSDVRGDLVIKAYEATNPEWGHIPAERPIKEHIKYGIINLDKPAGPTSHEIVAWVKRILSLKKAGHGGTLEFCKGIAE
jgi:H/ACA ribonucleoprotein complex subunit 4